jgi:hypothetical protein
MRVKTLTMVALAWAIPGVLSARAEERVAVKEVQVEVVRRGGKAANLVRVQPPAAADGKSTATSSDPAEPPLQVEMDAASHAEARTGIGGKVKVTSSARGTTLNVPTTGGYSGIARLTFKSGAPPMRFTVRLSRVPNYDLQSLSLTSGSVTLQVGGVSTSATTRYFNAKGQEQQGATGAAYTVTARRGDNNQVDIELRRAAGAALGKTVSISWQSNLNNLKEFGGLRRLRGG